MAIQQQIEEIQAADCRYHPFTNTLRSLAQAFKMTAIQKFVEQWLATNIWLTNSATWRTVSLWRSFSGEDV